MRLPIVCLLAAITVVVIIKRHNADARDGSIEELKADVESIEADHSKLSDLNKVVAYRNGKKEGTKAGAIVPEIGNDRVSKDVTNTRKDLTVHIAVVICGIRLREGLTMIKSAVIFTFAKLHFHVFAESHLHSPIRERLKEISNMSPRNFTYDVMPVKFPKGNERTWKMLFGPCASQRLFLPDLLVNTDSLIYLDTDILFTRPPEDLWKFFNKFNDSQLAALAPEGEDAPTGWYNKFALHPYYGELGINSGVMLMNLTRMRKVNWSDMVLKTYRVYKPALLLADQDILNIIFYFHPEMIYTLTCDWNYRSDHCRFGRNDCKYADINGISVLHGNRQIFHKDDCPPFRMVYGVIYDYDFKSGIAKGIYEPLKERLPGVRYVGYCNKMWESLIMVMNANLRKYKQQQQ